MLATLVFAGMRLSELLALRWRDVDLADGWLYVGHAKTDAGVRRIKIRPALRDELLEHQANRQSANNALCSARSAGRSTHRATSAQDEQRGQPRERAARGGRGGASPAPPHSLRRAFASVMFALNESMPDVMADGGWADSKIALTVYAHAMRREPGENAACGRW